MSTVPLQLIQLRKSDLEEEGLPTLNQNLTNIVKQVSALSGSGGVVKMPGGIDLAGSKITGAGETDNPQPGELVTHAYARKNFGADAIAPQLEAGGKNSLKSVRRINDKAQRENSSSFLNNLMNTSPTVNDATVSFSGVGGGAVTIFVSSGSHQFVDNDTVVAFASRNDTVSLPVSTAISTATRTGGLSTIVTATPHGKSPGQTINVGGVSDSSFDGQFVVASAPSSTSLTYRQIAPDALTAMGGTLGANGIYYYYLRANTNTLSVAGPFSDDSQQNRLSVNVDGQVLIAVAVVNQTGGDLTESSAGATPPAQTDGNRIINRL